MLSNNVDAVLDQIEAQQADRFELEPNATSLTLLQKVYRSSSVALQTRMRAAGMALQFEHPKLAVAVMVNAGDFADKLDKATERSRQALIEAKPVNTPSEGVEGATANAPSDTPHAPASSNGDLKPRITDRRYRRW